VIKHEQSRRRLMANRKQSVILFSLFVATAIIVSACTQPYSTVPLETPEGEAPAADAEATSLFVSPFPTSDNPMAMVEELSTGTALAETAAALTAGTPAVGDAVSTEITPDSGETQPSGNAATATATPPLSSASPTATQPVPTTVINAPGTYTLQRGEHPYCIARRFNVDPNELLAASGLTRDQAYSLVTGTTLNIPQTGNPFPGTRALRTHPDTYTVSDATMTVYGVACAYGDVDPAAIVQANSGLSLSSPLNVGQQISIP
jgi:LysM repeat protein